MSIRKIVVRWLLGPCFLGALSSCTAETAQEGEGVPSEESEPLSDPLWMDLGGTVDDLALSSLNTATPDIWAISGGQVWNRTGTTDWNSNASKPTQVSSLTYVAGSRRGNKTDIVATDRNGVVWARTRTGNIWGFWAPVADSSQTAVGKPAASTVTGSDRLDAWMRGTNNSLWHAFRFGSGAWSGWIDEGGLPGGLQSAPAVFTRSASPLIIDVVARGPGATTWHRAYVTNHWLNWEDIHLQGGGNPSIAISPSQKISVWTRGLFPDTTFYRRDYSGGWLPGTAVAAPSSGTSPDRGDPHAIAETDTVDLFVIGKATNVWRSIYFH